MFTNFRHYRFMDKHKDLNGFTWCDASDTPRSRIDFVFVNNDLLNQFRNILIRKIPGTHSNGTRMSDHRALKFELNIYNNQRGKGYWKMNVSILNEDDFKRNIIQIIRDTEKLQKSC